MNEDDTVQGERLSSGDRWLLVLFIPLILPVLGYLLVLLVREDTASMLGWVVHWCLVEFFAVCLSFAGLLFLWALTQARWIARLLSGIRRTLMKWLVWLTVGTIAVNLIVWLVLAATGLR